MYFQSISPVDNQLISNFNTHSATAIEKLLNQAEKAFLQWKKFNFQQKATILQAVKTDLLAQKAEFANLISLEMGKPISQAMTEIEKCANVLDFYCENAANLLAEKKLNLPNLNAKICYEPLG